MAPVIRLAGDVAVGPDRTVWVATADGPRPLTGDDDVPPGAPVAVGPAGASAGDPTGALVALVAAAGVEAAGAGVDLGGGFRSARLAGARGDRRDAVLAALRGLGPGAGDRLGERAAVLVALFGPAATRPVGAAAGAAIEDGRWAAVHLASAASDLLGPEQVQQVLGWDAPDGVDPVPHGSPSTLGEHLSAVLGPIARPRRLRLLRGLWDAVCDHQVAALRIARRQRTQSRRSLLNDMRERREAHEERVVLRLMTGAGREPTLAGAARWVPGQWVFAELLSRSVADALAATALLRATEAMADHGAHAGLHRCRDVLVAADRWLPPAQRQEVSRRAPGHPPRPGYYVADLVRALGRDLPEPRLAAHAAQRLAVARDYGLLVLEAVRALLHEIVGIGFDPRHTHLHSWANETLHAWRAAAGYVRPPSQWAQPPLFGDLLGLAPLADRGEPASEEVVADLLWYGDLADTLARFAGHEAAIIEFGPAYPYVDPDPHAEPDPLRPAPASVPLAAAGAAQLVSLGGRVPERPRDWAQLVDGLLAAQALIEADTGAFPLPEPFPALHGTPLPGTDLRVEVARDPGVLARWAAYMGNCIAGYAPDARRGRCLLIALVGPDGHPVANLDLRPAGAPGATWRVAELAGRFNAEPDPALAATVRTWVRGIRPPADPGAHTDAPAATSEPARPRVVRHRERRLREDCAAPLAAAVAAALFQPSTADALELLRDIAAPAPADPLLALTTLRRAGAERLTAVVRAALGDDRAAAGRRIGLARLWAATGARPAATALAGLDPDLRDRYPALTRFAQPAPLPGALRALSRLPEIAPARSMDLVALRLRAALGRLVRAGDPVLADAVATGATTDALCALVTAITAWGDVSGTVAVTGTRQAAVPGFPASSLADPDGPWQRARTGAAELGAPVDAFWDEVGAHGLLVPAGWLGAGGWPVLWQRAAHQTHRIAVGRA
jgi:hypothetical protein